MSADPNQYKTPGQLIAALLEQRGWTQRVLAIVTDLDETAVNRMVADKRSVTVEQALLLEEVFGVSADVFLDLQKTYDLAKARIISRPNPKRELRAHLFGGLPVAEMIKRGWLGGVDDVRDVPRVEAGLTRFFGVQSVNEIETLPHAAKKTQVQVDASPAQIAWIHRVAQIASEMFVPKYRREALVDALPKLHALMSAPEEARHAPRILSEAGVRYVMVETLPSAKIDGVCFWLNETSPVIGVTCRHDRIDNFWFVLRHEIEHVLRGHGQDGRKFLDIDLESGEAENLEQEQVANAAAADFCVPAKKLESFIARKAPFFHERDILGFASTLGVHPGLVAGQLRHRTGRFDRFRDHLAKIRSCVKPSAMVDGWGDVAPVGLEQRTT